MIKQVIFEEGDWTVARTTNDTPVIMHNDHQCWRSRANHIEEVEPGASPAVMSRELGSRCYWCKLPTPTFIQHMWTFVKWCNR